MVDTFLHVAALTLGTALNGTVRSLLLLATVTLSLTVLLICRPHRFKATLRLEILGTCSNMLALILLMVADDTDWSNGSRG